MRTLLAVAVLMVVVGTPVAKAVLMPDGANEAEYRALAESYLNQFLILKVTIPGFANSGYRSAVYLNSEYALTAAHAVDDLLAFPDAVYDIGRQIPTTSYRENRADVVSVDRITMFPGFNDDFWHTYPDIALIHFAQPLAGTPATIEAANVDEVLTAVGIGQYGTPSTGLVSNNGFARAWHAPVEDNPTRFYYFSYPEYYYDALFGSWGGSSPPPIPPQNGNAAPGDSGGPWFDADGHLVGLSIAIAGLNYTEPPPNECHVLNLSNPTILNWILANTVIPDAHPGDFNGDLNVDAADYVLWRNSSGSVANYDVWRAHFGESYAVGSSTGLAVVPEPHVVVFVVTGAMGFVRRRVRFLNGKNSK